MTTDPAAVIEGLVTWLPATLEAVYARLNPNRCIMAARVGSLVLSRFGIPSRARAVAAWVGNATWHAWALAGFPPPMPEAAYAVGTGRGGNTSRTEYDGHVLLETRTHYLDLDLRGFARPAHDIRVPSALAFARDAMRGDVVSLTADEGRALIIYELLADRTWDTAPDWRRTHDEAVTLCAVRVDAHLKGG